MLNLKRIKYFKKEPGKVGVQITLSRLNYYKTLKQLNKSLFELNASIDRLPGYRSYVSTHVNLLTPKFDIDH